VKAAEALHPLMSWAQIKVIRVRQNDLRAKCFQIVWIERLYCGIRTDRHEVWGLNDSVP
jgi:hypothetical protein